MTNLIENFFTEERRIQGLIKDAVYEKQQELEKAQEVNKKNQEEIKRLKEKIKELENN